MIRHSILRRSTYHCRTPATGARVSSLSTSEIHRPVIPRPTLEVKSSTKLLSGLAIHERLRAQLLLPFCFERCSCAALLRGRSRVASTRVKRRATEWSKFSAMDGTATQVEYVRA